MTVATNASTNVSRLKVFGLPFRAAYPIAAAIAGAPYEVARKIRQRKTRRARFLIGLSFLGVVSSSVTAKQQIFGFIGAKQDAPAPPPVRSQATPDAKENTTFKLRLISDGNLCPMTDLNCSDQDIWWKKFTLLASDGNTL
jgi:hypothetical protein